MWDKIYHFVMVQMVYIAAAVFICGIIFKTAVVFLSPKFKGSLTAYPEKIPGTAGVITEALTVPSALKKSPVFWFFIILFHLSFTLLFIGHLELISEFKILQIWKHDVFLGAGFVGVSFLISVFYFLFRRFSSPWREISVPEDYVILLLLLLTAIIGSHLHLAARYGVAGFDVDLTLYREYLSSLFAFKPVIPDGISGSPHYVLIALHIFLANLVLIMLPFSKIIHMVFAFMSLNLKRK